MNIENLKLILLEVDSEIDTNKINETTKLVENLGFDSLKMLEFYSILETKNINIVERSKTFKELNEVGKILNLINNIE